MSTRANIIIKDEYSKLYFYRHSDGYPKGAMPTLSKFLDLVKTGKIRDNVGQASGWLIILGHEEYLDGNKPLEPKIGGGIRWKVGAIEPTGNIHGDIEFLYIIDLVKKEIQVIEHDFERYAL